MIETGIPCFNLQERLLPVLRAETARRLSEKGLPQGRIAEHLGVSQAMVSKYIRKPPRPPAGVPGSLLERFVDAAVDRTLAADRAGTLPPWCPLCTQLAGPVRLPAALGEYHACLRGEGEPRAAEAERVLDNVRAAERRIRATDLHRLAPEVQVNVAMSLTDARDTRGVAAFPGRLVEIRGTLTAVSEPEFGASRHLAELLLRIRRGRPEIRGILCLRHDEHIRRALRSANLAHRVLRRAGNELVVTLPREGHLDAAVDPGAFGIEPITYVVGESALDAVDKALRILEHVPKSTFAR